MPQKRIIRKKNEKNKKAKRILSKQELNELKLMQTRKRAVLQAISECKKILKNKKRLVIHGTKAFGERIESIVVFSRYMSYYPQDLQATHYAKIYHSMLQLVLEKKQRLSPQKYGEWLIGNLQETNRRINYHIRSLQ